MEFLLSIHQEGSMMLTIPPLLYQKLIIPLAIARYYIFPGGSLLSQEIKCADFDIWQYYFFIQKPSLLYSYSKDSLLAVNYMLEGTLQSQLHGFGNLILKEGYYNLFYIPPDVKNEVMFMPGAYRSIHVNFSLPFLKKMAGQHPFLKPFLEKADKRLSSGAHQVSLVITRKIRGIIEEIVNNKDAGGDRQLLLEARIRELLLIYLRDQKEKNSRSHTTRQSRIINELTHYISENLDQDLSVSILSKRAMISKSALQLLFKHHYNKSIHRFILDMRMQKAMEMLKITDLPIGEIAMAVTNKSFSHFSFSFTKHFGHPPSYYRKNR